MFKKISVFLVLVLVITTLSACAGSESGSTELTEEKKKEISRAWLIDKKEILDWDDDDDFRYYGNYDGYDMFYYAPLMASIHATHEYKIAGETFIDGKPFRLTAYRNGKFYDMNEIEVLYLIGLISRKSLVSMAETHKTWFPEFYNEAA